MLDFDRTRTISISVKHKTRTFKILITSERCGLKEGDELYILRDECGSLIRCIGDINVRTAEGTLSNKS